MAESKENDPYWYLAKSFKGTLFGPAEFLNEKQRRYRWMNTDEMMKYSKKVKLSKGFDVSGCTGFMTGRIAELHPCSLTYRHAQVAAKYAFEKHSEQGGPIIEFLRLVRANNQAVAGSLYYLTIAGRDTTDGIVKAYRAKVWAKAPEGFELILFERARNVKVKDLGENSAADNCTKVSNKKTDKLGKGTKKVAPQAKVLKVYSRRGRGSSSREGGSMVSDDSDDEEEVLEPKLRKRIAANAFLIVVEEIRSKNPRWTYATARRVASNKWRKSLSCYEKFCYEKLAETRLMEKQAVSIDGNKGGT